MVKGVQVMERNLDVCNKMQIVQTRRGWFQECFGCEARTEFKYYNEDAIHFATSLDDSSCFCRICCKPSYPFVATIKEEGTEEEIIEAERPFKCAVGCAKCCCYQELTVRNPQEDNKVIGKVQEQCWYCVPRFLVLDSSDNPIYKVHQPTCCGGCCVDCCAEGNPCCGRGCCLVPFSVFPASQEKTNGREAAVAGKILRKPRSLASELFTDADVFDVDMPEDSTADQRALLVGTTLFLNANFFEGGNE